MALVLNIPGWRWFRIYQEYAWICLNMLNYTGISLNMPKSDWIAFVLHFLIAIPCLLKHVGVVTYFNVYSKLEVRHWGNMIGCFLEDKKQVFSRVAWSIWFVFCFRLNIFTSKISNCLLPLGAEEARGSKFW